MVLPGLKQQLPRTETMSLGPAVRQIPRGSIRADLMGETRLVRQHLPEEKVLHQPAPCRDKEGGVQPDLPQGVGRPSSPSLKGH